MFATTIDTDIALYWFIWHQASVAAAVTGNAPSTTASPISMRHCFSHSLKKALCEKSRANEKNYVQHCIVVQSLRAARISNQLNAHAHRTPNEWCCFFFIYLSLYVLLRSRSDIIHIQVYSTRVCTLTPHRVAHVYARAKATKKKNKLTKSIMCQAEYLKLCKMSIGIVLRMSFNRNKTNLPQMELNTLCSCQLVCVCVCVWEFNCPICATWQLSQLTHWSQQ